MLTNEQLQLIEEMGIYHEKHGLSPIPARILGLFVVSDEDAFTFEEIKDILKISKSATSSALNLLVKMERIEYTTLPGDRKRYFKWSPLKAVETLEKETKNMFAISKLLHRALDLKTNKEGYSSKNILMLIDYLEFMGEQIPYLYEKWKKNM